MDLLHFFCQVCLFSSNLQGGATFLSLIEVPSNSHKLYFWLSFFLFLFCLQLLEWGRLWEATCQWCLGPQWWDLLPVPWWCPPGQEWPDQTDKEIGEPLYISFILLVLHQEIMVLWLGVFSNCMTRKTCSPFLSERVVLEGSSGTEETIFVCIVKCENKIVNSFS